MIRFLSGRFLEALSILPLVACSLLSRSDVTPVGSYRYAPVSAERVQVSYQEPSRPYEVIALLSHTGVTRFATVIIGNSCT
jgi:hypothetical protein